MKYTASIRRFLFQKPVLACLIIYLICYSFRMAEYLLLRTDEGVLGESFAHKLFGILFIFLTLRILRLRWREIGFISKNRLKNICMGLCLGAIFYTMLYAAELLFLYFQGANPALYIAAGSFSLTKTDNFISISIYFVLLFNVFNVWMEEGLFRGLFTTMLQQKYTFVAISLINASLFGLWHLAMPFRAFLDGEIQLHTMLLLGAGYAVFSFIFGLKMSLLYKLTGSLWLGMADHFFNNTIINIIHITSDQGNDTLQIARIVAAQLLSFAIIYLLFIYHNRRRTTQPL